MSFGDGLKAAVSGKHTTFKVKFVDTFGNTAIPNEEYKFFCLCNETRRSSQTSRPTSTKAHGSRMTPVCWR